MYNNNCDGDGSHEVTCTPGVVKLLPIGGGGNLILCHAHYAAEINWRAERNAELEDANRFDLPAWKDLKLYNS